jgi:hypothetical protein
MHYCERLQGGEPVALAAAVTKLTLLRVNQHRLTPGSMRANSWADPAEEDGHAGAAARIGLV